MGGRKHGGGPPTGLVNQLADKLKASKKNSKEKNKNLLGHIERRRHRRKLVFDNRGPPAVPVVVPPRSEKDKYWFKQTEVFVVIPQRLTIAPGKERKFELSIPTWITCCAGNPNAKGEVTRSTLEVATASADAVEASAALLEMFGAEGAMSSKAAKRIREEAESRAKRPEWMSLATVASGRPSTVVKHLLMPGVHCLRANGTSGLFVSLFAKGRTVKLM